MPPSGLAGSWAPSCGQCEPSSQILTVLGALRLEASHTSSLSRPSPVALLLGFKEFGSATASPPLHAWLAALPAISPGACGKVQEVPAVTAAPAAGATCPGWKGEGGQELGTCDCTSAPWWVSKEAPAPRQCHLGAKRVGSGVGDTRARVLTVTSGK